MSAVDLVDYRDASTFRVVTADDSTTRATALTPSSGGRVQMLAVTLQNRSATATGVELYFHTGANITSNAGKEITEAFLDLTDQPTIHISWPGGGPVGGIDEVVSIRTSGNITTNVIAIGFYREIS